MSRSKNKKTDHKKPIGGYIIFGALYLFSITLMVFIRWAKEEFVVDLGGILFTLQTQLKGTDSGVTKQAVNACAPLIIHLFIPYLIVVILDLITRADVYLRGNIFNLKLNINLIKTLRVAVASLCLATFPISIIYTIDRYDAINYFKTRSEKSTLYETYYVDPKTVDISCSEGENKNLIYIYLESMETSYADTASGGTQEINLIPNLTAYAEQNVSFSNSDKLGGFSAYNGTTWTLGSMFASHSGVPFSFPVQRNSMGNYENFATGITTLGDILHEKGYVQEFLCGSDASYAGRDKMLTQHGDFEIFDYFTAIEKGYIEKGYYVWWGFEDKYLYDIAKDEITRLASGDQPFHFSMLTVDTHFTDGYICDLCNDNHDSIAANVVECSDRQIYNFIEWCKQQDFYDDTVIVLIGDHPRMDNALVNGLDYWSRTMYNCIINSDRVPTENSLNNRLFSVMDMMPTVLSAIGYDIEGDRIGLGTNLFSDTQTLSEVFGDVEFNKEIQRHSDYYIETFS